MPQMAPIWWFTLFTMFVLSFMTFMFMLYFFNIYNLNTTISKKDSNKPYKLNWKW